MHIDLIVEEQSAEAALSNLMPKLLPEAVTWNVVVHRGKHDLLQRLAGRLKAYRRFLPPGDRIFVLVDKDRDDCRRLKSRLDAIVQETGLVPKSKARSRDYHVVNRLAIEELEAWFFGDGEALAAAFPRVPSSISAGKRYRDPDAIAGGTAEALERVLKGHGYYRSGMPKIEVSRRISQHMDPKRNRSRSFQVFARAVREMVRAPDEQQT